MILQPAKLKPYLFLLVILLIAFLPVSAFYFGMKNDAFSDNFPNKFFFTEAIHSGFLPLWNPYLNFGFPVYADPGFAFWNPITWFFGAVIGYNAYTLTAEVLLYIYIAGITMYRLGKFLNFTLPISIAIATMFMCSGFFTGELQHINFITAAAFLPWLLQKLLTLFQHPNYKNAFLCSVAMYMVFAGGHPSIPIGTIYFFTTLIISIFIFNKAIKQNQKLLLKHLALTVIIFLLLYSPAVYSYLSVINQYARGESLNQFNETTYGFSPASYLSFIFPFATVKNTSFLTDDVSMRNIYFSLAGFALTLSQIKNKNYLIRSLFITALIMLLLSSGGYIKGVLYSFLPFLKYIKTNGEFRIFSILSLCVIAGYGLNEVKLQSGKGVLEFRKIIRFLSVVSILVFFYAFFNSYTHWLYLFKNSFKSIVQAIKFILDNLTFNETLLISSIINAISLSALLVSKGNIRRISLIIIADLIVNSIAYLPFTGVGTVTLSEIQNTFSKSENGIIKPPLIAIKNIDTFSVKKTGLVGSSSFYNKKIGITHLTDYPSYFSTTKEYFKSESPDTINNLPYIFLKKNIADANKAADFLIVDLFSPQKINIKVNPDQQETLVLLQNYYKFWKAKVDGHEMPITKSFTTFLSIPLTKGNHLVEFYYHDNLLFLFFCLSIITFVTGIAIIKFSTNNNTP